MIIITIFFALFLLWGSYEWIWRGVVEGLITAFISGVFLGAILL